MSSMSLHSQNGWKRIDSGPRPVKLEPNKLSLVRIPILGARGSGQQQVIQLVRACYGKPVGNIEENENLMDVMPYKAPMRTIAVKAMVEMVKNVESLRKYKYSNPSTSFHIKVALSYVPKRASPDIPTEIWKALKYIWKDSAFTIAARHVTKWETYFETESYFKDIERLSSVNYVPSSDDVMTCRKKLNSILETPLTDTMWLLLVPPIGRQTKLKRILQYFDRENFIIYCVDASSYDQFDSEGKTRKLRSAYDEFIRISHHELMKNMSIIVFFTWKDIFERKLSETSLRVCFPEYTGPDTYEQSSNFITNLFRDVEIKIPSVHIFSVFLSCNYLNLEGDKALVKMAVKGCFLDVDYSRLRII